MLSNARHESRQWFERLFRIGSHIESDAQKRERWLVGGLAIVLAVAAVVTGDLELGSLLPGFIGLFAALTTFLLESYGRGVLTLVTTGVLIGMCQDAWALLDGRETALTVISLVALLALAGKDLLKFLQAETSPAPSAATTRCPHCGRPYAAVPGPTV